MARHGSCSIAPIRPTTQQFPGEEAGYWWTKRLEVSDNLTWLWVAK